MINGHWLTINEYAEYRKISISTIRRYIKSHRVQYKFENRKYYIYLTEEQYQRWVMRKEQGDKELQIIALQQEIKKLREENSELKMLVDLYEQKNVTTTQPPELPLIC